MMNYLDNNTLKRREKITDLICKKGIVSVNHLSLQFGVSTVTIRNDLRQLEKQGCLMRSYGGAILNKLFAFDRPLPDKNRLNFSVKNLIAQKAAELVDDGDRIILDSGSTTALMIPYIKEKKDLIVFTNSLQIAYELAVNTNVEVIVAGGSVRKKAYSISSPTVEQLLKLYRFDKLFLGVDGFDLEAGITTPNFSEASINKIMCEVSQEIIVVTDSSKFGRKSFCAIEKIEKIKQIVTDSDISDHYLNTLLNQKITVNLVNKKH